MKDFYYLTIIIVFGLALFTRSLIHWPDRTHNDEYILMIETQLTRSVKIIEAYETKINHVILLANEACYQGAR
jgi:hypothetical protein